MMQFDGMPIEERIARLERAQALSISPNTVYKIRGQINTLNIMVMCCCLAIIIREVPSVARISNGA